MTQQTQVEIAVNDKNKDRRYVPHKTSVITFKITRSQKKTMI